MQDRPRIIGHRGACGYRPEHTASAYELAFALGADAVEPDIVATRDGVLVVRHENEISSTTDVASQPEFADRRTTKLIDGEPVTGWFTEDFTWPELATLRARERLPELRHESASFDGRLPILRLADVFALVDRASDERDRPFGLVAEFKHATHFESIGLPLAELFAAELDAVGWSSERERLVLESFELDVLAQLASHGVPGKRVFLVEAIGSPYDRVAALGSAAPLYSEYVSEAGLLRLAATNGREQVHGVSVNASILLGSDGSGAEASTFVDLAHAAGLDVFTWTLRPENRFLAKPFRRGIVKAQFGDWLGQFTLLMRSGVDAVFADHPDLAVEARAAL